MKRLENRYLLDIRTLLATLIPTRAKNDRVGMMFAFAIRLGGNIHLLLSQGHNHGELHSKI